MIILFRFFYKEIGEILRRLDGFGAVRYIQTRFEFVISFFRVELNRIEGIFPGFEDRYEFEPINILIRRYDPPIV